jgi:succinate dehydrogenase / fumarate reductase cytochrome b subunit
MEVNMSSLRTALTGYARYRGKHGQISFLLHRITGLGTLLFLALHILDTFSISINTGFYMEVIGFYRSTFFGILEIVLVFCVLYHGANGLRLAIFDMFAPKSWNIPTERASLYWTLGLTAVFFIPAAYLMIRNLLTYNFGV